MRGNSKFSISGSLLLWILGLSKTYVNGINMKIATSGATKSCPPSYTLCITMMVQKTKSAWIGNTSCAWTFLYLSLHHWPCRSTYTSHQILTLQNSRSYPINSKSCGKSQNKLLVKFYPLFYWSHISLSWFSTPGGTTPVLLILYSKLIGKCRSHIIIISFSIDMDNYFSFYRFWYEFWFPCVIIYLSWDIRVYSSFGYSSFIFPSIGSCYQWCQKKVMIWWLIIISDPCIMVVLGCNTIAFPKS